MKGTVNMDDQFLYDLREDPSPEFAEKLRRKLNEQVASVQMSRLPIWRKPAAVALAAAAVFLISLSFPVVRAVAQQFLDLFRVQRFVAQADIRAAMERIGAGFHHEIEDARLCPAVLGRHSAHLDLELLYGFN